MNRTLKELKTEWEAADEEFAALDDVWQAMELRWSIAWRAYQSALEKELEGGMARGERGERGERGLGTAAKKP